MSLLGKSTFHIKANNLFCQRLFFCKIIGLQSPKRENKKSSQKPNQFDMGKTILLKQMTGSD